MNTIEKKYNEALERAKAYYNELHNCRAKDELESIFPELRESEDERIRKVIYKLMLGMREEIFTSQDDIVTKDKALAWLEKQKEQKPNFDTHWENGSMVCEQKKPKPAWSEEDEKKIHFLSRLIEFQVKDDEYCFGEGFRMISKQEAIEMLKSLRPQPKRDCKDCAMFLNGKCTKPQWKPTEEQMEAFKGYIEDFQARAEAAVGGWNNFDVMIRLYEQLKKLREDEK